jgi:alpha-galactosidase/6-phospho-beta-glucosidase family protein
MTKIAFSGAGSLVFTRELVRDLLTFPLLEDATIALLDIDPERLDFSWQAAELHQPHGNGVRRDSTQLVHPDDRPVPLGAGHGANAG